MKCEITLRHKVNKLSAYTSVYCEITTQCNVLLLNSNVIFEKTIAQCVLFSQDYTVKSFREFINKLIVIFHYGRNDIICLQTLLSFVDLH